MTTPFTQDRWILTNSWAAALLDNYPVSEGHYLIVPQRIVGSVFDLSETEIIACWRLMLEVRERVELIYKPHGFNIGVNVGAAAGQTVDHAHIHLIPRYEGDHPNPRGGVRAVIPGKAEYR